MSEMACYRGGSSGH